MEELLKIDRYFAFQCEPYTIEKDEWGYYKLRSKIYNCNSNTMEWLIKTAVRELQLFNIYKIVNSSYFNIM